MKKHPYLLLLLIFLSSGLFNYAAAQEPNPTAGTFTFERKGKTYTAKEVEGNIIMPASKKNIYFMLSTSIIVDGKTIDLAIHFRNQDDLVAGKAYTLVGKLGTDAGKPRHILYVESADNDEDGAKAISCGSDTGTLTFSTLTLAGKKAIISGGFQFKGKNNNDHANAEKEISVKGDFNKLEIRYISSSMFKP